jgi:hypothetical protein
MCTIATRPPNRTVPPNCSESERKLGWPVGLRLLLGALACAFVANAQSKPTTTALVANTTVAYSGAPVTLDATVTAGATAVIAGQIRFQDGARVLNVVQGIAHKNGSLTASIVARLTGGAAAHSLTATYLGAPGSTSKTAPSTSAAVLVQTVPNGPVASTVSVENLGANSLAAIVRTDGPVAPSGSVTFVDQSLGQTLGTVAISPSSVLPLFSGPSWPAGRAPGPLVYGDFNNDGLPDLAVVNTGDSTVSVYLNNADNPGQFLPAQIFDVGPNPAAIVAADFNADGILDLAVANGDSTITLLFGTDSAKLFTSVTLPAGVPVGSTLLAADLNGDGLPDLVFVAATVPQGDVSALDVLFNTAATPGTFSAAPVVIGLSTPLHFIAAADFNLDGFTDLVVDNAVYLSNGMSAQFLAPQVLGYPCGCAPILIGMTVAGLEANGLPDVVLLASTGFTGVFVDVVLSNSAHPGQFLPATSYPWPATSTSLYTPIGLAVGPLNANGIPDIFSFGSVTNKLIASPIAIVNSGSAGSSGTFSAALSFSPPSGLNSNFALVDLNDDGIADLAFSETPAGGSGELVTAFGALSATVTLTDVTINGSGQQSIVASYSGNRAILSSASTALPVTGGGPAPVSVLMVPSTLTEFTNLGLTVAVNVTPVPASALIPTGTVTLWDGGTQSVAIATLDASGNGVLNPTLAPGTHSLSTTYSGDNNFAPATSTSTTVQVYGSSNATIFSAAPNPIQAAQGADGQTTLSWNAPAGVTAIQVRVNAPNGSLFAGAGPVGSATTGTWVNDGMEFFLQDVSDGKPLAAANTLGTVIVHLQPDTTFWANGNPIPVAPGSELGITRLVWSAPAGDTDTSVVVGSPTGTLLSNGGNSCVDTTGLWVTNGLTFYLLNVERLGSVTLDSVAVTLAPQVMFSASPSPVPMSFLQNNQQVGSTTLSWNAPNSTSVRIRIGDPSGTIIGTGGTSGSITASAIVTEGTIFYLEDASGGAVDGTVLGSVVVNLQNPVQFTATPNPITAISVMNGIEVGSTTLQWNAPGRSSISIVLSRPFFDAQQLGTVISGGASGSITLNAQDGDVYMLEDTSLSPPVVIGSLTILLQHQVQFSASPNPAPILTKGGTPLGETTLTWNVTGVSTVSINVGAPNGVELTPGGPSGSALTGLWVTDGMTFYLQDTTGGKALTAANTLGTVTVHLQ